MSKSIPRKAELSIVPALILKLCPVPHTEASDLVSLFKYRVMLPAKVLPFKAAPTGYIVPPVTKALLTVLYGVHSISF